jgi:hypothetical protein
MEYDMSGNATRFGATDVDESSAKPRSERDRRAINLACSLLMVGIAVERQVVTLVRARPR